jgi:hypothetical protein
MSIESVTVNTVEMTPAAAEEFAKFVELLGDREGIIWQPEFQSRVRNLLADEAVDDFLHEWEDPIPLHSNANLPTFPLDGMPPVLKEMVEALAEEIQVPVDLVAVIVLSVLSAALVGRVKIGVHGSWEEVVTLYGLGLAESGNRKTALVNRDCSGPRLRVVIG